MDEVKKISLVCEKCGGTLMVDDAKEVMACPYCGSKTLLVESDNVTIERIRTSAQKEVELERIRVDDRKQQRLMEQEREQEVTIQAEKFRKSKWFKLLIVGFLIAVFCAYSCFSDGKILGGILAVLQAGCFGLAWMMGMQIVKEKKRYMHILIAIVGMILIVPTFRACNKAPEIKEVKWSVIFLGEVIPEPNSKKLDIHTNTSDELWMDVVDTSDEEYYEYITACKEWGYTIDVEEDSKEYIAYNDEGYYLELSHYDTDEMRVELTSSKKLEELKKRKESATKAPTQAPPTEVPVTKDESTAEPSKQESVTENSEIIQNPQKKEDAQTDPTFVDPEFKKMMDSYEEFFDEYIEMMNKISKADSMEVLELMGAYSEYLQEYTDMMEEITSINQDDLSAADALYYAEVTAHIYQKLAKIQ